MRAVTTLLLLLSTAAAAQVPPPPRPVPVQPTRDVVRAPEPTGTGVIRGRVVAGDSGNPIRRASVSLQPMPPPVVITPAAPGRAPVTISTVTTMVATANGVPMQVSNGQMMRPRTATTDQQGAFEFSALPAGTYRIIASGGQYAAAYLGLAYGAKKPASPGSFDPGTPIELADGQRFDKATIALPRGAVITGRVTDDGGEPMARVQVYTMFYAPGSSRGQRVGGAQTDDLGQFRLFGLAPGDYAIVAEARGPTFVPPNAQIEIEEDQTGFLTTYYPGTPDEGAAQRVRARAAAETPGLEIRMVTGRLYRISGMVTDSQGRASGRMSGSLVRGTSNMGTSFGFSTDQQGRFQMRNIPPGSYRLMVRGRLGAMVDGTQNEPPEMASMPLTINADVEGLVVTTSPGATITGQVAFEQGPPQQTPGQPFQMRVNASEADLQGMGMPPPQPAVVGPDLTFTLKGLMGELLLRGNASGQYLKAVLLGGDDITDTPRDFKNGDRVTLVMTSHVSTVEGTVTDAKGQPTADAALMIFSEDRAAWRPNSTRTRRAMGDQAGHYRIPGVLPGRYYIVAVSRERMNVFSMNQDAGAFEQLSKDATTFVVGEDEQRQVDVKIALAGG